jgi:hypothetical protein
MGIGDHNVDSVQFRETIFLPEGTKIRRWILSGPGCGEKRTLMLFYAENIFMGPGETGMLVFISQTK